MVLLKFIVDTDFVTQFNLKPRKIAWKFIREKFNYFYNVSFIQKKYFFARYTTE